jgi:hypothetical protein
LEVLEDAPLLSEERVDDRGAAIRMEGLPSWIVAHGVFSHTPLVNNGQKLVRIPLQTFPQFAVETGLT